MQFDWNYAAGLLVNGDFWKAVGTVVELSVETWLLGIVAYHALAQWAPEYGSALPTLVLTFVLGALGARIGSRTAHAA